MKKSFTYMLSILLLIIISMSLVACSEEYTYYDVSFDLDGGEMAQSINHLKVDSSGEIINLYMTPYKDNHYFMNWYLDEDLSIRLTAENLANAEGDIKLYAKWKPYPVYTVTYVIDEDITETEEYMLNSSIDFFDPKLTLFMFQDWYKDSNFEDKWDRYSDYVDSDITLYAQWEIGFDYTIINNEVTIDGFKDNFYDIPEVVDIPSSIEDITVTRIAEDAFSNDLDMLEVTIPSTIDYIGKNAFKFCSLEKVTFSPNSNILTLPEDIFFGCDELIEISLPTELMEIDKGAFQYCEKLSIISMPYNIQRIGFSAFEYCYSLTNLDFGTNPAIREIDNQAFSYCTSLSELVIPSTIERIGDSAFSNCSSVSSLTFNLYSDENWGPYSNLNYLGYNAFDGLIIDSVILPLGIEEMGTQVFNNCDNLHTIQCMESEKPVGWEDSWNYNPSSEGDGYYFDVEWGYTI